MYSLSQHPVGKSSTSKAAGVADMLTQLPKRAAFVRTGEFIGAIYTQNTPPALTGAALRQRMLDIRDRTRTKYCHPTGAAQPSIPDAEPVPADQAIMASAPADTTSGVFQLRRADAVAPDETIRVRGHNTNNQPAVPPPPRAPHLRRKWQEVDS